MTDRQVLHYFELPKLPKIVNSDDELKLWLTLFNAKTEEDLAKIEALEVSVMNEAIEAYRHVAATDEFKEIERLRYRARHNEASALRHARNEGRNEGRLEGMSEGEQKGKINVVRNALREKMPIEIIARLTGLSVPEVEQLANEFQCV